MLKWKTGTGPIPAWVHAAADADLLYYDQFMLLRVEYSDPVRIDIGDVICKDERGRLSVERAEYSQIAAPRQLFLRAA